MHGVKESPDHLQLSAGQLESVERIRSDLESLGAPDITPVAALDELCSSAPGYAFTPVNTMPYAEGRVALPPPGDKCDASGILTGHARDLWHGWHTKLLRPTGHSKVRPLVPFTDAKLKRSRISYAHFVAQLLGAGCIVLGSMETPTVGLFFVAKKRRDFASRIRYPLRERVLH